MWSHVKINKYINKKPHVKNERENKRIESMWHSGAVDSVGTLQLLGLILSSGYSVCRGLHVLPVSVCVSSMFSGFLPSPKNIQLGELVTVNCPDCEWRYPLCPAHPGCIPTSQPVFLRSQCSGSTTTLTRIKRLLKMKNKNTHKEWFHYSN